MFKNVPSRIQLQPKRYNTNDFWFCIRYHFHQAYENRDGSFTSKSNVSGLNFYLNLICLGGRRWSKSFVICAETFVSISRVTLFGRLLRIQINLNQISVSNLNSKIKSIEFENDIGITTSDWLSFFFSKTKYFFF